MPLRISIGAIHDPIAARASAVVCIGVADCIKRLFLCWCVLVVVLVGAVSGRVGTRDVSATAAVADCARRALTILALYLQWRRGTQCRNYSMSDAHPCAEV